MTGNLNYVIPLQDKLHHQWTLQLQALWNSLLESLKWKTGRWKHTLFHTIFTQK